MEQTVEISGNAAPVAAFTATGTGFACTFDGSGSSDADGNIANYIWGFGDGTSGSGVVASHRYAAAGSYTVMLSIWDNGGALGSQAQVVTLANSPPVATFTLACGGLVCSFNAASSSDPDGTITSYWWNFGDGQSGSGSSVSHTYAVTGSYTVTLTVADNGGSATAHAASVTVSAPTLHVGDLDGAAAAQQSTWTAAVTLMLHDALHGPLANATVTGSWSTGAAGSCTTSWNGQCSLSAAAIPRRVGSVTFTVGSVTHATSMYTSAQNHESDGDSDGTSVRVVKP